MTTRTARGVRAATLFIWLTMVFSAGAQAAGFALVTNANDDSNPGSLRYALEVQQANLVLIPASVGDIDIASTLEYGSEAPLMILGAGQTVGTTKNITLLAVTEGANLTIRKLNFAGPGNFDINNRGDLAGPAGKGIFVDVRDDQTGTVRVNLTHVGVSGVANHGIHISDCSLADDCGGGSGGGGEGSPASVKLVCNYCDVDNVGNGTFDADGIRIDDRGDGGIDAWLNRSSFTRVGADGVELDEGNDGSIFVSTFKTDFSENGNYCDPLIIGPFIPDPDEMKFDREDGVTEDQIPTDKPGSPDDSCIEREVEFYADEEGEETDIVAAYEFGIDLDDGIDLDEAGDGSLWAVMKSSTIHANLDEGVDFDEEGEGDISVAFKRTTANNNNDDGFKLSEEDGGNVYVDVRRSGAMTNGGKGFVFEEADDGDLVANVRRTNTSGNDDEDDTGIEAVQEDAGSGKLRVRNSDIADGIDLDGVDLL